MRAHIHWPAQIENHGAAYSAKEDSDAAGSPTRDNAVQTTSDETLITDITSGGMK